MFRQPAPVGLEDYNNTLSSSFPTEDMTQAIKQGNESELDRVISSERRNQIDLSYKDELGNTLMHIAVSAHAPKTILTKLAKLGCPLKEKNLALKTPLDCSKADWQKRHLEQLLEHEEQKVKRKKEEETKKRIDAVNESIEQEIQTQKRIHPGIYLTPNLALTYEGRNPAKKCAVPDQWEELDGQDKQAVSLHQRLAMTEALVVSETDDLTKLKSIEYVSLSDRNYATVNVGFIVSNKEHKFHKDKDYKRIFITIPVDIVFM